MDTYSGTQAGGWLITSAKRLVPVRARPAAKGLYWHALPAASKRTQIADSLRGQARWCLRLGSPLYSNLLDRVAGDVEESGACWAVLRVAKRPPVGADDNLPFRFMAGVHRLVLMGRVPSLARHFPSAGGTLDEDPWPAFIEAVSTHVEELREELRQPVQTNEVGRCAALVGGFLVAAQLAGGRLRVLELGASAGLNLNWDRYRYEADDASWGDPASPVRFQGVFADSHPPFHLDAVVVERLGCDLAPLDPSSYRDSLTLTSLVWPDQLQRFSLLSAALQVARRKPARVDAAHAPDWLATQLSREVNGVATVVFHSFLEQYLTDGEREQLQAVLASQGQRATSSAPLAHLRMEWGRDDPEIVITTWPGGKREMLATADNQGRNVCWFGG
jgi:hypothetical protein